LLAIPFILVSAHVQATDGDLQRALFEASCPNVKITRLPSIGQSVVYEANCFETSHRRIKIVCMLGRCSAEDPAHNRDDPE
jgi:hypothetical protein